MLAECRADLARDGFRTNDAKVLGESDEDQRTMENHASRPEIVPALARRQAIASAIRIRSDRTLTEFVVP